MKKLLSAILLTALLLVAMALPAAAEEEAKYATILFTHDLHSHLLPL